MLAAKLLLAPLVVVAASVAARRWGPALGGVLAGLPLVAGPILLLLGLAHGDAFAATAASSTLSGLLSLSAFVAAYAALARTRGWRACLLGGGVAAAGAGAVLGTLRIPTGLALALVLTGFGVVHALTGGAERTPVSDSPPPPRWDLAVRALVTGALVFGVSEGSGALGPRISGLLAALPLLAGVLAAFTHAHAGGRAAVGLLRGLLAGCVSFALFCFAAALAFVPIGLGGGLALGTGVALVSHLVLLRAGIGRGPARAAPRAGIG